jgi:hypothetical protein
MANITVTPANVAQYTGAVIETGVAGEAIDAGKPVYKSATTGKFLLADAAGAAHDDVYGIALNKAQADGQPLSVQTRGDITIGGTVIVGTLYMLAASSGGICPVADLVSTNFVTLIGIGISATVIRMSLLTTSVQIPA